MENILKTFAASGVITLDTAEFLIAKHREERDEAYKNGIKDTAKLLIGDLTIIAKSGVLPE